MQLWERQKSPDTVQVFSQVNLPQVEHVSTKRSLNSFLGKLAGFLEVDPAEEDKENTSQRTPHTEEASQKSISTQVWTFLWYKQLTWRKAVIYVFLYNTESAGSSHIKNWYVLAETVSWRFHSLNIYFESTIDPVFQGSERTNRRKALFATPSQPVDLLDTIT